MIERVLDLVVYAPVGLVVTARRDVPGLVAEGRQRFEQRVQVARWIGEMTVTFGRKEIQRRIEEARADRAGVPTVVEPAPPVELTDAHLAEHPPEPFEGYDSLPASALVQRLVRLPHSELHLVRAYETAHRGRRTVLAKVDALLGD